MEGGGGVDGRCSAEDARAAVVVYRRGSQPDTSIVRRSAFRSYGAVMRRVREREWGGTYESCGSVGDEMSFVSTTEHRCWLLLRIWHKGFGELRDRALPSLGRSDCTYTQRALSSSTVVGSTHALLDGIHVETKGGSRDDARMLKPS